MRKATTVPINIHGVVIGPHTTPDMDEDEYVMVVIAVVNGQMHYDFELYSDSLDWMYEVQKWCSSSVEPYVIGESQNV